MHAAFVSGTQGSGRGVAVEQQIEQGAERRTADWTGSTGREQKVEQKIGQGKEIGVALGEGARQFCGTPVKNVGSHWTKSCFGP